MTGENGDALLPPTGRLSDTWRFRSFVASAIFLLLGLVWFFALHVRPEPSYHGKPLAVWLRTYGSSRSSPQSREWREADDAVRHIGTNCIPVLLRMIAAKDSRLKLGLGALAKKQSVL